MPTTVTNKYKGYTKLACDVDIMRPGEWGNPFVIGRDGTRGQCIAKYRALVLQDERVMKLIRSELKDKRLVCCCKPKACHGDVLAEIANSASVFD